MIDPLTGQAFGQYELHDRLGHGGMAAVYRASQPALGRAVAIKILPLAQIPDPTLPERFRREARLAANLLHPNIVPVYDFGELQGYLYIVMALIAGGTLKDRLPGPLPVEAAIRLVSQVADALGYAHGQGVFHRDVKPANILLGPGDWAMLSDFGIARALGETPRLTGPYGTIGTPAYMAPEQWLGDKVDGRADLYALGIVLYELLVGSPPFPATTGPGLMRQHLEMTVPRLPAHRADLPAGLNDVVQTVLAKEPDRRYRHAGELKAALEAVMRPPQIAGFDSGTSLAVGLDSRAIPVVGFGPAITNPHLGQTMRVARPIGVAPSPTDPPVRSGGLPTMLIVLIMTLVVLLAGTVGYIVASSRGVTSITQAPTPTSASAATPPTSAPAAPPAEATVPPVVPTAQPPAPTAPPSPSAAAQAPTAAPAPTVAPSPAVMQESTVAPTSPPPSPTLAPPPPTATVPPPTATAPPPTAPPATATRPAAAQPTAPAKPAPSPTSAPDQRLALVERHVGDYFAALNAADYAKAQAACCTPAWRSRFPLDDWKKNFAGVTDLKFSTPFRYTTVEPGRIVAEVDYSFANSGGGRRSFTLRWTFVPVGNDWLADDAVAFAQQ